jgi:hypothetical protein
VTTGPPQADRADDAVGVDVHLYQVRPDDAYRRRAPVTPDPSLKPALPLRLRYFVSAFGPDGEARQSLLGAVMRALYLEPQLDPEARVEATLVTVDLDELQHIWGEVPKPRTLGIVYDVGTVLMSAEEVPSTPGA